MKTVFVCLFVILVLACSDGQHSSILDAAPVERTAYEQTSVASAIIHPTGVYGDTMLTRADWYAKEVTATSYTMLVTRYDDRNTDAVIVVDYDNGALRITTYYRPRLLSRYAIIPISGDPRNVACVYIHGSLE